MKRLVAVAAMAGLGLAILLIARSGAASVLEVLGRVGWGFVPVVLVHQLQMLLSALGWQAALAPAAHVPLGTLLWLRWLRESIDGLLPVAQVGGEVACARLLARRGLPRGVAGASVVVDLTYEVVSQFLYTLAGVALFAWAFDATGATPALAGAVLLFGVAIGGFVLAQRWGGLGVVERAVARFAARLPFVGEGSPAGLQTAVHLLYSRPRAVLAGVGWHLASWVAGTVEVWLILALFDMPVGWREAFVLEAVAQAVRSAAFFVPGALGVQEGGLVLAGTAFGLAPDAGLALSLAKRVRELVLGLPGLCAWQWAEGRPLLARSSSTHPRHEGVPPP